MRSWRSASEEETQKIGAVLATELLPDGVLLLRGDLGSGKTVLAKGVASGLGIDPLEVQSPSYVLIREHRGELASFVHVDLYRLEPNEVLGMGLEELLAGPGVKIVEWSERLPFAVPTAICLELSRTEDKAERQIVELGTG